MLYVEGEIFYCNFMYINIHITHALLANEHFNNYIKHAILYKVSI